MQRGGKRLFDKRIVIFTAGQLLKRKASIKALLDTAEAQKKITAAQRPHYEKIAQDDLETTKAILDGLQPMAKPSEAIKPSPRAEGGKADAQLKDWDALIAQGADAVEQLKTEDPKRYIELYKARFGFAPF